ncbi:transmembrane GTPase fzo-1-like [Saccostrea echinata]|uniref:transmembrane GTPase fzo-1-like n=1 Tax=Saccostrea echinata TaxID=191078 RepID=UPI002A82E3D0|nr:transmembrane GTPase fzo-1-like [Saccostrea echinata]
MRSCETSGGKSTLVNRLVGRKIFKPSIDESTATICRIRNSNDPKKISCKVVGKNDQVIDERSFESGQDEKIRKFTEENVDKNAQLASMEIDHVDVGLYFPFLKGNTLIVDTPGIGGSRELSDKMMKYLPNAVAFIFVSNVANAGGVQRDRLVKIIQEVVRLHDEKDITCLDPRNALFISNKWDAVPQDERDEGWSKVQRELKKHWPHLTSENIFRTSLMSTKDKEPDFDAEFERFKERLAKVVERSQYTRQIKHLTSPCHIK